MSNVPQNTTTFFWYDYTIIVVTLAISTMFGIYFGILKKKSQTIKEYLLGGKQMSAAAVGISVAVSHVSGGVLILVPAEIYKYGSNTIWIIPSFYVIGIIGIYVFLPALYNSQVTTIFEYLEKRFDSRIKYLGIVLYLFKQILDLISTICTIAIIFKTGINIDPFVISVVCSVICIFYTAVGGLKTVIWSDIFQFFVMITSLVLVVVVAIQSVGGVKSVYDLAVSGQRLDIFDFDLDPTKRDGFWIIFVGYGFINLYHKVIDQAAIQKFLAVASLKECKKAILYSATSLAVVYALSVFMGLIIYAKYHSCDPLSSDKNIEFGQLVPYFIMDVAETIPGTAGLFAAGVLCAGLGTMSSMLNANCAIIYINFFCHFYKKKLLKKTTKNILTGIVIGQGIVCICISYWYVQAKEIRTFTIGVGSLVVGSIMGLIILAVSVSKINPKSVLYGTILAVVFIGTISYTSLYFQMKGMLHHSSKPLDVSGCSTNTSGFQEQNQLSSKVPYIFRILFYYLPMIGAIVIITFCHLINYVFYKKSAEYSIDRRNVEYSDLGTALQVLPSNKQSSMDHQLIQSSAKNL